MVDVEFIAQVMVLKWGKDKMKLRLTSTRQVLEEMMKMQLLAEPQGRFLLETYDLYRRVEKGLRLASEQAPNTLPVDRELVRLARRLGTQEAGALAAEIEQRMQETRRLFESLLSHLTK
jgi:glutamine synthetase adenylyltransferase